MTAKSEHADAVSIVVRRASPNQKGLIGRKQQIRLARRSHLHQILALILALSKSNQPRLAHGIMDRIGIARTDWRHFDDCRCYIGFLYRERIYIANLDLNPIWVLFMLLLVRIRLNA